MNGEMRVSSAWPSLQQLRLAASVFARAPADARRVSHQITFLLPRHLVPQSALCTCNRLLSRPTPPGWWEALNSSAFLETSPALFNQPAASSLGWRTRLTPDTSGRNNSTWSVPLGRCTVPDVQYSI